MRRYLAVLAILAACGGDGDGGPIGFEDLPGAIIGAYCSVYVSCGIVEDFATCRTLQFDVELAPELAAAIEAGLVIYHSDQAGACIGGLSTTTCERNHLFDDEPEACNLAFEGTVPGGGECGLSAECISGQCDIASCPDACCKGTCFGDVRETRPHVGDSCASTGNCVNSFCDPTTQICTAYLALGAACQDTGECLTGVCATVCTALPDTGDACTAAGQQGCKQIGDVCSPTTMTCVALGLAGDPCTADPLCSPAYLCGTSGSCVLRPRVGEMCGSSRADCIDNSFCNANGVCQAPQADGATCNSNSECMHDCDSTTSTCITPPVCI